jgi:hypothetical protein
MSLATPIAALSSLVAALCLWTSGAAPRTAASVPQDLPPRGSIRGDIVLTPTEAVLPGGRRIESDNVLARALEWAGPGARILLGAGDYPPLGIGHDSPRAWNSKAFGGTADAPVRVSARGRVRILAGTQPDALTVHQQVPSAYIEFDHITFVSGDRAGIVLSDLEGDVEHRGFRFFDCTIDGGFDHRSGLGTRSKWGVLAHDMNDFVYSGRDGRAVVKNTCREHAFYLQNPRGDISIEHVDAFELGRTFVQIAGRERTGAPGRGLVRIVDNDVRDIGIAAGDGYKGGSAFTFMGRLEGCTILLEGNRYRAGFVAELLRLRPEGGTYGTSALAAWDEGQGHYNGTLVLRANDFETAPGCGDRPLVAIHATRRVIVTADNRFVSGGKWPALHLDPVDREGRPTATPNGAVQVERGVTFGGVFLVAGALPSEEQLAALAVPLGER